MSRLIAGVSPKGPTIWRADAPEGANRHQISPQSPLHAQPNGLTLRSLGTRPIRH